MRRVVRWTGFVLMGVDIHSRHLTRMNGGDSMAVSCFRAGRDQHSDQTAPAKRWTPVSNACPGADLDEQRPSASADRPAPPPRSALPRDRRSPPGHRVGLALAVRDRGRQSPLSRSSRPRSTAGPLALAQEAEASYQGDGHGEPRRSFRPVHQKRTGCGHLYHMRTGSPVLPDLSLYRERLNRGVHELTPDPWQLLMRTPVIVAYTSLDPVGYQGPGE
jgi:hypothetical protein